MFDTSLYIYVCVKNFGMTNIKKSEPEQFTYYPSVSHLHSSGHSIATFGWITNRNQNITACVATPSPQSVLMAVICTERGTGVEQYGNIIDINDLCS